MPRSQTRKSFPASILVLSIVLGTSGCSDPILQELSPEPQTSGTMELSQYVERQRESAPDSCRPLFTDSPSDHTGPIEEVDFKGGVAPFAIIRDSYITGWMCSKNGEEEEKPDFIALFQIPNAYDEYERLRVRGTTWAARHYIWGKLDARIDKNDNVAACIGYKRVKLVLTDSPKVSDLRMKLQ